VKFQEQTIFVATVADWAGICWLYLNSPVSSKHEGLCFRCSALGLGARLTLHNKTLMPAEVE